MIAKKNYIRRIVAFICSFILMIVTVISACTIDTRAADVSNRKYSISKGAGTYEGSVTVKIKAKKNYKVYYATGNVGFTNKKLIKSGKTKKFTFSKTTTLKLYAIKSSKKLTNKILKTKKIKKKATSYTYTITTGFSQGTGTSDDTSSGSATQTGQEGTSSDTGSSQDTAGQNMENPSGGPEIPGQGGNSQDRPEVPDNSEAYSQPETPAGDNVSYDEENTVYETVTSEELSTISENTTTEAYVYSPIKIGENKEVISPASLKLTASSVMLSGTFENTEIKFDSSIKDPVTLKLNGVTIDNSGIVSNEPVIQFSKKASTATLVVEGTNTIKGAGGYDNSFDGKETGEPAPVIKYNNASGTLLITGDESGVLNVIDSMPENTEYLGFSSDGATAPDTEVDPSDGISTKGTIVVDTKGSLNVTANGSCLKGKAEENCDDDDNFTEYKSGGVTIKNGTITLESKLGKGISSKYGLISIAGGNTTINSEDDAVNAKYYKVQVTGGKLTVSGTEGDGIQSEEILITGGDLDIKTTYKYAATNFYKSNFTGKVNSETENESTGLKTETINYDTGSHKALKAGTKECINTYTYVEDGSTIIAGQNYSQEASGGITITGGKIKLDTTAAGIKYNGGSGGMGAGTKTIIGSPDDAIHSNHTTMISGGSIVINSSDDGISSVNSLEITGDADVRIETAYEGIESGTITIGSSEDKDSDPKVYVYSNDDGINAGRKTNVIYAYADESEETYVKTAVKGSDNTLYICSGTVHVEIADDQSHSVTLYGNAQDGSGSVTYTYTADGDGIDCNGSFYAYGGTIEVIGGTGNGNGVIDRDGSFVLGSGVTLFAIGSSGMIEGVTNAEQAYVSTSSASSGGPGGMGGPGSMGSPGSMGGPGGMGNTSGNTSSFTVSKGSSVTISNASGAQLYNYENAKKTASYLLFSSPALTSGDSVTVSNGTTQTTLTATTSATTGQGGMTPPGR